MRVSRLYMPSIKCNLFLCRDGHIKKGDEILMINGKSVVGLRLNQVVQILRNSQSPVHFLVATKVKSH